MASHLATVLSALAGSGTPIAVEDLVCPRALVIKDGERYQAQILVGPDEPRELSVQSLIDPERGLWQRHLSGRLGEPRPAAAPAPDRAAFTASAERHITGEEFYDYFRKLGYTLGPSFRWIADVWIRGSEALVRYARPALPDELTDYEIYPGLIDSCFQSIAGFMVDDEAAEAPSLAIPFAAARLSFPGRPEAEGELWGHVMVTRAEPLPRGRSQVETADLHMFTGTGASVMVADGFRVRHAPKALLEQSLRSGLPNAYAPSWTPLPEAEPRQQATPRRILLLGGVSAHGPALAGALRDLGHEVTEVTAAAADRDAAVDPTLDLVVDARLLDGALPATAQEALAGARSLAATLNGGVPRETPYALLADGSAEAAPVRESAFGLLTALEAEDTERLLLRVVLDPGWSTAALAALLIRSLDEDVPETRLALGADGARVARIVPVEVVPADPHWSGGVLITGGLGALGLSVARIVAAQGAPSITLMGRSEPDAVARGVIGDLVAAGTRVSVVTGDVTQAADCARAVRTASAQAALRGVFHLAGVTDDRAFGRLTPDSFDKVFAAKALGADCLAEAVSGCELDAFVLFSSVSAVLGSAGQVNYAAANGYLDGLALSLRAGGRPVTSVNWGPWVPEDRAGLAGSAAVGRAAERLGVRPLTDAEAAPLLALAVAGRAPRLLGVALDAARYVERLAGTPGAALVGGLTAAVPAVAEPVAGTPKGWLRVRLDAVAAPARDEELREALRELVGRILGDPSPVRDSVGFADLGLDSIMVIDLRTQLAHALDTDLPATVALDHPTIAALARFADESIRPDQTAADQTPHYPTAEGTGAPTAEADPESLTLEQLIQAVQNDLAI